MISRDSSLLLIGMDISGALLTIAMGNYWLAAGFAAAGTILWLTMPPR